MHFNFTNYLPINIEIEAYRASARIIIAVRQAKVRTSTIISSTTIPICPHLPHGMVAAETHLLVVQCDNKTLLSNSSLFSIPMDVHRNI